jgi:hypothetical protein
MVILVEERFDSRVPANSEGTVRGLDEEWGVTKVRGGSLGSPLDPRNETI